MSRVEASVDSRPLAPLAAGERLARADFHDRYLAMPEDARAELVDGVVFLMTPLRYGHGDVEGSLAFWLQTYRRRIPGLKCVGIVTTRLGAASEVQPDLLLHVREEFGGAARVVDDYLVGPPELVVEVAQSSRPYDLGVKKDLYERSGVAEYLVVGVEPAEVAWFALRDGRYEPIAPEPDGTLRSRAFPGLWLDPAALFSDDLDRLVAALERGMATPEHAAFVAKLAARGAGG